MVHRTLRATLLAAAFLFVAPISAQASDQPETSSTVLDPSVEISLPVVDGATVTTAIDGTGTDSTSPLLAALFIISVILIVARRYRAYHNDEVSTK
jgi:hypothetical protein